MACMMLTPIDTPGETTTTFATCKERYYFLLNERDINWSSAAPCRSHFCRQKEIVATCTATRSGIYIYILLKSFIHPGEYNRSQLCCFHCNQAEFTHD